MDKMMMKNYLIIQERGGKIYYDIHSHKIFSIYHMNQNQQIKWIIIIIQCYEKLKIHFYKCAMKKYKNWYDMIKCRWTKLDDPNIDDESPNIWKTS